jgi:hypothetical protein
LTNASNLRILPLVTTNQNLFNNYSHLQSFTDSKRERESILINELERLKALATLEYGISPTQVRSMIVDITSVFNEALRNAGQEARQILRVTTKFRDAGRRSPPWQPNSQRVPGRPQDGADGNRRLRWLFEQEHKFHADEITATLTEVKYFLQALSMNDAPELPQNTIQDCFGWLIEHRVIPGTYLDPIQLIPISLPDVLENARIIQSGHLVPLDRGGRHVPRNTFLMLSRSNQLQGNLTLEELLSLMDRILQRHREHKVSQ